MTNFRSVFLIIMSACQFAGLVLFLKGFFPIKKAIPGSASLKDLPPEPGMDGTGLPLRPVFDRLVIVLIDALRADFVLVDQRMEYTRELIENNETLSFIARAHPPTVTMPRIKALMTGGIPGFLDVVLNSFSTALQDDNLLAQLKSAGRRIVFFGDDTWIKLFPAHFTRSDGTTSFFVTDYTEVDDNVTRHLDKELQSTDWDVMILHYLGLDHIGHLAGPTSPLIGSKLSEMDNIIKDIHRNLIRWDQEAGTHSAVVLCGDHGMSHQGSHGGATVPETSTPLVVMSSRFQDSKGLKYSGIQVDQTDLVPSLSILLGLAIPQNSIGTLIPQLLKFHTPREKLRAFQLNAHQLSKVLQANGHSPNNIWELEQASRLHKEWLQTLKWKTKDESHMEVWAEQVTKQYVVALKKMSSQVAGSLSCYDLHAMASGILVLIQVLFWLLYGLAQHGENTRSRGSTIELLPLATAAFTMGGSFVVVATVHVTVCSSATKLGSCSSDILCSVNSTAIFFSSVLILLSSFTLGKIILLISEGTAMSFGDIISQLHPILSTPSKKLLVLGTILHVFSLLSSSFVEEEHQTWYFLIISYFLLDAYESLKCLYKDRTELQDNDKKIREMFGENVPDTSERIGHKTVEFVRYLRSHKSGQFVIPEEDRKRIDEMSKEHCNCSDPVLSTTTGFEMEGGKVKLERCGFKRSISSLCVSLLFLVLIRIFRSLNQTGMKWADQPDVSDWLIKHENKPVLSFVIIISLLVIIVFRFKRNNLFSSIIFITGLTSVYSYRTVTGILLLPWQQNKPIIKGLIEARIAYCCSVTLLSQCVIKLFKADKYKETKEEGRQFVVYRTLLVDGLDVFLMALLVIAALLLRPHNIALLAVFVVQECCMSTYFFQSKEVIFSSWVTALVFFWLGSAFYFALGNSNSLATVDIAAGYIGMEGHDSTVVLVLMLLSTFCGPLLWLTSLIKCVVKHSPSHSQLCEALYQVCVTLATPMSLLLCVYCSLVYGQRYHLFVWSVFSPKLLYEGMWTLVMFFSTVTILVLGLVISRGQKFDDDKED